MLKKIVEFKGRNFILSVIHLHDAKPEVIRQELAKKIAKAPSFLKKAPVVINVSNLTAPIHWQHLQRAVTETGLRIIGISGCKDPKLKEEIEKAGLSLLIEEKEKILYSNAKSSEDALEIKKPRLIDVLVRSGQRIYASNCDLIITSHVNAGAELISDGNIHVYGTLCGKAFAGANGNKAAQIFCTNLTAELVFIAGKYWLSDQIPSEFYGKAARLRLAGNSLTIQSLN